MHKSTVIKEIKKREAINNIVDVVLDEHFVLEPDVYVRRGVLQRIVADAMGVYCTTRLAQQVINRLKAKGVEMVVVRGYQYFKNVRLKGKPRGQHLRNKAY